MVPNKHGILEWWVISYELWVMSDEWWVMKIEWRKRFTQTGPNILKEYNFPTFFSKKEKKNIISNLGWANDYCIAIQDPNIWVNDRKQTILFSLSSCSGDSRNFVQDIPILLWKNFESFRSISDVSGHFDKYQPKFKIWP